MKFEEILPLMRQGKKARLANDIDEDYWICGYQNFIDGTNKMPIIIRMDKNDCAPLTQRDWGIARWMIMDESWEIVDVPTD